LADICQSFNPFDNWWVLVIVLAQKPFLEPLEKDTIILFGGFLQRRVVIYFFQRPVNIGLVAFSNPYRNKPRNHQSVQVLKPRETFFL